LRPYQVDIVAKFQQAVAEGTRKIILVSPTGSGKTIIGNEIIRDARTNLRKVVMLAHRRKIIGQTSTKLHRRRNPSGWLKAKAANIVPFRV
jgi:DNA repair protein RadD